ncbi:MAG TPA: hypothetical protein VED22_02745 [Nitrososphaerales archaeon]|nr:hypothetical protein [Nitrososphaerales archaeon]
MPLQREMRWMAGDHAKLDTALPVIACPEGYTIAEVFLLPGIP